MALQRKKENILIPLCRTQLEKFLFPARWHSKAQHISLWNQYQNVTNGHLQGIVEHYHVILIFYQRGLSLSKNKTAIIHSTAKSAAGTIVKRTCNLPQNKKYFSYLHYDNKKVIKCYSDFHFRDEQIKSDRLPQHSHLHTQLGRELQKRGNTTYNSLLFPVLMWRSDRGTRSAHTREGSSLSLNSFNRLLAEIIKGIIMKKRSTKAFDTLWAQ